MSLQEYQRKIDAAERDREFVEWMELLHDMDLLAARDPEPEARREFTEWAEQAEGGAS